MKTIGIVSLSSGTSGEDFVKHEVELGTRRLKEMGLNVKFMSNALKGIRYLKEHPEKRADDLIEAYMDKDVDIILCAIGGDDTYRLAPYLFENDRLKKVINDKPFLGFSDTTINHFMLYKLGVSTYYGQSFLADICEMSSDMLPYSKKYFKDFINNELKEIVPSDVWYESREDYSVSQMGTELKKHENKGYEVLQGKFPVKGKILGGCIDSIYDMFNGDRYADMPEIVKKYELFPADWSDKILLLETSEEIMPPDKYRRALGYLKDKGVFDQVRGIICGKPMNNIYYEEYKEVLIDVIENKELPILYNFNIGHGLPRCIVPFNRDVIVSEEGIEIL